MKSRILTIFALTVMTTTSLSAGVIPGRWEKFDGLESGSKIVLTSKAGDSMRYSFKNSDSTSLTVRDRDGRELVVPKTYVAKVVKQNPRSTKAAWIGTAVGAGTGVAIGAGVSRSFDETPLARADVMTVTCGLVGALVGFTTGYLIAEKTPDELLYEAPKSLPDISSGQKKRQPEVSHQSTSAPAIPNTQYP